MGYSGVNLDLMDGRFKNRFAFGYTDLDRDNFDPDQAVTDRTFNSLGRNKRWEYQGSFALAEGWDAVFGAEYEKSSFNSAFASSFDPNPIPTIGKTNIASGFAQLQAEVVTGLTLTGGLRYDSHSTFGDHLVGQAAAAWSLNEGSTILRASFSQGFKAPTLYQLYSDYGNPGLTPETADSWDGGIEQHLTDKIIVSAIGFYRKTKNQIDFVNCPGTHPLCTPGKFGVYDNTAASRAKGVELTASAEFDALSLQANYTYTDAENPTPGANLGKQLARRPKNAANFTATYTWPVDVSTGVGVRYVGDTFDSAGNTITLQDYTLVDLRASWQINETVELYGRIENLFDKAYVTTNNYGTPGRGAFAGVRAKF